LREYALGRSAGAANLFTFSQPIWRLNNFDIVRDKRDFFIAGPGDRGQIRSSRWSEPPSQKNIASCQAPFPLGLVLARTGAHRAARRAARRAVIGEYGCFLFGLMSSFH